MGQIAKAKRAPERTWSLFEWRAELDAWAKDRLASLDERMRELTHERPLLMLFGAATFGCIAGRVLSRR